MEAGGLCRDDGRLLSVMEVLVLFLDDFADADIGGKVGYAENKPAHPVRGGRDVIGLDQRLRRLYERLDLDAVAPACALFQVVEQLGNLANLFRPTSFGQHDPMEPIRRAEY